MNLRRLALPALLGALLAAVSLLVAQAQSAAPGRAIPAVTFTTPDGASAQGDPHEWMIQPGFRKALNKQMLQLTAAQDRPLRASRHFGPARAAIERYFEMGPNYAYVAMLGEGSALYLSYGQLFRTDRPGVFFDPLEAGAYASPSLEGFALSPDGRTLAVSIGDGGTEIAMIHFVEMDTGEILPQRAGPAVIGGDLGFVWLDEATGVFRRAATTSLVDGDPSIGAEWTLFDLASGRAGAAVFGAQSPGVETEFGDWLGFWVPEGSTRAMGYLWRGNFIDAYSADLAAVAAGRPVWTEIGADLLLSDVEIWRDHYIINATDAFGNSSVFALPLAGGPLRMIARGEGETSYLYTVSLGEIAYIAARKGDTHALYRLQDDAMRLYPIVLPVEGEIDFESFYEIEGAPGSVTFDMSSPTTPWQLMRLDPTGPAYPFQVEGLGQPASVKPLPGVVHTLDFATSLDGSRVPLSITYAESAESAPAPTIIHAYGSYGETTMAGWNPAALAWVRLGGVQAECHVRGSGYYGPQWHADGSGPDKQRSHEDLIACGERMVELGFSQPGKIAALGGSAGGLVATPVAIQRPDLFSAAIVEFGVVNPLRGLDGPNGATQIDEFGDPRIPEDRAFMAASDSVELARTAPVMPNLFLCVGFQDSRVPHWMSARLAAVMAERGFGDRVVIHADADAGHSCGYYAEDQRDALAKQYAWLLDLFAE